MCFSDYWITSINKETFANFLYFVQVVFVKTVSSHYSVWGFVYKLEKHRVFIAYEITKGNSLYCMCWLKRSCSHRDYAYCWLLGYALLLCTHLFIILFVLPDWDQLPPMLGNKDENCIDLSLQRTPKQSQRIFFHVQNILSVFCMAAVNAEYYCATSMRDYIHFLLRLLVHVISCQAWTCSSPLYSPRLVTSLV